VPLRLADNVRVRQESWGLLFYRQKQHKLCFVRSADWLRPEHFDGSWTPESIIHDISRRTGAPPEIIERSLSRLTDHLDRNQVMAHEIR
jgi:putative mycofactocin binding protein MftB